MGAEDPLFILYTSGSHRQAQGRAAHHRRLPGLGGDDPPATSSTTTPGEIYWCTADVGWVTGHSYIVYGPLANGATTLMFEGVPNYPTARRFWEVVDKHKVNIFYTAPTAIRALMREGEAPVKRTSPQVAAPARQRSASRSTRRPGSGTTGSSATSRCPIVDTWWQTETGGILITPLPGAIDAQAGLGDAAASSGVQPALVDAEGKRARGRGRGQSLHRRQLARPDAHASTATTSASSRPTSPPIPGMYFTGDGAGATRTAITGSPAGSTT